MPGTKLNITLVRSLIGLSPKQEATVKALGLRKIRQTVVHEDNQTIRGMIARVSHCLSVTENTAHEA